MFEGDNLYNFLDTVETVTVPVGVKYYPVGFIHKKDARFTQVFSILIGIAIGLSVMLPMILDQPLIFLFFIPSVFALFALIICASKRNSKPFTDFAKTLDIEKLEEEVISIYQDKNIHPNTRNYVLILFTQYARLFSLEKYENYLPLIRRPLANMDAVSLTFDSLYFLKRPLTVEDVDQIEQKLTLKYAKSKSLLKSIKRECDIQRAVLTGTCKTTIESLQSILNRKFPLNDAAFLFNCAVFYHNQGNQEKFLEYKNAFLEKYSCITVLKEQLSSL